MNTELTLPEIKASVFEILKHFKDFCTQNDITFFLSNGTLLGAVKYGGFIPWDDDIDVLMPRADYDKLIDLYRDSERYHLFSTERVPAFRFPFAKLCDRTTIKVEENIDNGVELGLDIDIFPIDSCTEHMLRRDIQLRSKLCLLGYVLSKFKSGGDRSLFKRSIIRCCRMCGYAFFHKQLSALVCKEVARGSTHMGCLIWPVYGSREVLPADVFSKTVEVTFEGETFPAPIGYDAYLRSLYGDYPKDPPKEKQKTHHSFKAYRV